jgi:hypothetical protein
MDDELQDAMQAICSVAFAVDALYGSLLERIVVPQHLQATWKRQRTSRHARILELIRLSSVLRNDQVGSLKRVLSSIFRLRGYAVHPPAEFRDPVLHPDLNVGINRRFTEFSSANAERAVNGGAEVMVRTFYRPRGSTQLRDWCTSQRQILQDILEAAGIRYSDSLA